MGRSPQLRKGRLVILGGVVAALALGVFGRLFAPKRLRFPYLTGELSPARYEALASRPGWRASKITVAPGIRLNGLVRRPTSPDAPWVLFYQGNDAELLAVGQAFLSRVGEDRDWGLAVYAYRGYDSSDGTPKLQDLAADAPEILAQLCATEKVSRDHVHLVGFSIGGHFAVRALAVAALTSPKPASLSLLASVDDIVMYRRSPWEMLDPGDDLQTRPLLDAIPAPVLVIQGTADEALAGPGQGRNIAAKLGTRARYLELPGLGHKALLDHDESIAPVRDFIAGH